MALFNELEKKLGKLPIIVEDLGFLTPSVHKLLEDSGFPGMKVIQFAFDSREDSDYLPHNYPKHCVVYTGTHDNDTVMEWYGRLSTAARRKFRKFLKRNGAKQGSVKDRVLAYTLGNQAEYAIIPMADILGLGKEGHINTPGTIGSPNWEWHLPDFVQAEKELVSYGRLIVKTGRS